MQDCSRCGLRTQCWRDGLSVDALALNLLACRAKQRDADAIKSFLTLVRPKVRITARKLARRLGESKKDTVQEIESVIIEELLVYPLGSLAHPLHHLFHPRHGRVSHWARKKLRAQRRLSNARDIFREYMATCTETTSTPSGALVVQHESARITDSLDAASVTPEVMTRYLTLAEHRVWCARRCAAQLGLGLQAANTAVQSALASSPAQSQISRVARQAAQKLSVALGALTRFCEAKRIALPEGPAAVRREAWLRTGKRQVTPALSPSEERAILAMKHVSSADCAVLFGVPVRLIYSVRACRQSPG